MSGHTAPSGRRAGFRRWSLRRSDTSSSFHRSDRSRRQAVAGGARDSDRNPVPNCEFLSPGKSTGPLGADRGLDRGAAAESESQGGHDPRDHRGDGPTGQAPYPGRPHGREFIGGRIARSGRRLSFLQPRPRPEFDLVGRTSAEGPGPLPRGRFWVRASTHGGMGDGAAIKVVPAGAAISRGEAPHTGALVFAIIGGRGGGGGRGRREGGGGTWCGGFGHSISTGTTGLLPPLGPSTEGSPLRGSAGRGTTSLRVPAIWGKAGEANNSGRRLNQPGF